MRTSNLAIDLSHLPSIIDLQFKEEWMHVNLSDGRIVSVPLTWYPRLAHAKKTQLKNFEISPGGYGVHWPDLDEDLGVKGFLFP